MEFVTVNGLRLAYQQRRGGPNTIVFLHDHAGSSRIWREIMERLPADFQAVALDLRGCGDSDKPHQGYDVEDLGRDVAHAVEALHLRPALLVGHGLGGLIALEQGLKRPELYRAIVPVNPIPADGLPPRSAEELEAMEQALTSYAEQERLARLAFNSPVDPEWIRIIAEDEMRASLDHHRETLNSLANLRFGFYLEQIWTPTLFILGDRDREVPVSAMLHDFLRIPGAGLQCFHGAGHFVMIERADAFVETLVAFAREQGAVVGAVA